MNTFSRLRSLHVAAPVLACLALGLAACDDDSSQAANSASAPPPEVAVMTIKSQDLHLHTDLPGRTTAFRVAEVRPQVTGIILKRMFEEGSNVKEGDQLYQIDPSTYDAAVASAKADLAKAKANLKSVEAKAARYRDLVKINAISKQDYDDAVANLAQGKADVMVAEAALRTANINLTYTKVYAPISGRIGKSNVTEGALVTANQSTTLTTITQLDPIYADLNEPSSDLMRLKKSMEAGAVKTDKGTKAPVHLLLDDNDTVYDKVGELQFSDVTVDQTTSTVQLRAVFPNPNHDLYPGMFVRGRVDQGVVPDAMLVSQRSVVRQPDGSTYVWVVSPDNKVSKRTVVVGDALGDQWLVKSGLKAGEKVVTSGLQKIADGAPVRIAGQGTSQSSAPAATQKN